MKNWTQISKTEYVVEMSDLTLHQVDPWGNYLDLSYKTAHRDDDNEITHWTIILTKLGKKLTIYND
jgi:hypothetical protein